MEQTKSEYQIGIIQKIKALRTEKQISQQQIAQIIDSTNGQVGNIESLKYPHKYTLKQLSLLAAYFNVPVESLFLEQDEKKITTAECIKRICKYLEGE